MGRAAGFATLFAFCMTVTKPSDRSMRRSPFDGGCDRHLPAIFVRAGGAAPRDLDDALLVDVLVKVSK